MASNSNHSTLGVDRFNYGENGNVCYICKELGKTFCAN
jgi:hypothetical protein